MKLLIFLLTFISIVQLHAGEPNTIAVMDFETGNLPAEYKKIIRDTMEDHLLNHGKFKILEKEKIDFILNERRIKMMSENKKDAPGDVGKILNVDFLVTGSLLKENNGNNSKILIQIKNAKNGDLLYSYTKQLDARQELNTTLNSFASRAIDDIKYYVINGKIKKTGESPTVFKTSVRLNYLSPTGSFKYKVKQGYGPNLFFGFHNLPVNKFIAGIETGVFKVESKIYGSDYYLFVPVLLSLQYRYNLTDPFFISPELKGGALYMEYKSGEKGSGNLEGNSLESMISPGMIFSFLFSRHTGISLGVNYSIIFEEEKNHHFLTLSTGLSILF